jgi:hypothetical protein
MPPPPGRSEQNDLFLLRLLTGIDVIAPDEVRARDDDVALLWHRQPTAVLVERNGSEPISDGKRSATQRQQSAAD